MRQAVEPHTHAPASESIVRFESAEVHLGGRQIWSEVSLCLRPGEFAAVLGPNGEIGRAHV